MAEQWNGTRWTARLIPAPPGGSAGPMEGVSCSAAGQCTAIGRLTGGPGGTRPVVERWNGSTWTAQVTAPLAEHWNGSTWSIQATPLPSAALAGALNGVSCPTAGMCTAAGWWSNSTAATAGHTALAEAWNGGAWHVQPTAFPPSRKTFNAISCAGSGTCSAVGITKLRTSTFFQPLAEHE